MSNIRLFFHIPISLFPTTTTLPPPSLLCSLHTLPMGERSRDDNKPSQANNNNPPRSDDDVKGPACDLSNAPRRNSTSGGDQPSKDDKNENKPAQSDKRTTGDQRSRDNVDNTTGLSQSQTMGEQSRDNDRKPNAASSHDKTMGERSRDDDRKQTDSSQDKTMGERSRDNDRNQTDSSQDKRMRERSRDNESNPSASSSDNTKGEQSKDNKNNPKDSSKDETGHRAEKQGSKDDGKNHNKPTNKPPGDSNSSSASNAPVDDGNNRNKPTNKAMENEDSQGSPPESNAPQSHEKSMGQDKDIGSTVGRDNAAKSNSKTKGQDNDDKKTGNAPSTGNRKAEQLSMDNDNSGNSPPSCNKTTEGNNNEQASDASPPRNRPSEDSNTSVTQDNAAMSRSKSNENRSTSSNKTKDDNNPTAPNASSPQEESTEEYPVCVIGNERKNKSKKSSGNKTTPQDRNKKNMQPSGNKTTPQERNNENKQSSGNKTTAQERNNDNKQSSRNKTKDEDHKQRGSNVSYTRRRTPGELPQDDDNQMCILDHESPTDDRTSVDENSSRASNASQSRSKKREDDENSMCVLENVPQAGNKTVGDDAKISSASLPPPAERSNTSAIHVQPPPRKSGQQFVEDENESPIAIYNAPSPHSKSQSYTHQLRTNTGTNIKRHRPKLHHKHSLDDTSVSNNISGVSDSEEDEYYAYEGGDPSVAGATVMCGEYAAADGQSLPEFYGNDVNAPEIFKAPRRAAVHPNRPPFLELRPHPLRETQVGKFLRTIASTDTQLWAGQESGVRVWRLSDAYELGIGIGGRARRGDEDAAPFYESVSTSPTMCLAIDCGTRLVWSGHKDGKIRSWNMDETLDDNPFLEGLSWQAHRGPVLSLVISSCGDLWSGSEGGHIHVWPWEAIDKSLSLKVEERHMASLLIERSFINLRSQVTVNGCCNISSQDVKVLCADKVVGKVWASGSSSFSLWDARTRELLKVYNVEGHIENRAEMPQVQDQGVEDEMSVKLVSKSKKEKSGFLQRSRNAIMGAAGAVRRAATKSGGDESKKTEAVVLAPNGLIYSGCTNGIIVQWDGNGNRLQEFNHHPCAVLCFCTHGSRIWVGYVSGMLQVLDLDGNLIAGWIAHNGPVIKLVVGNGQVFSLATHGGIRGWNIAAPGPIDQVVRPELSKKELSYTRRENIKILVGTWNVGQGKSSHDALMTWIGSAASDVGIFVVGLQEVEMGAGFLAMSAAKETVGLEGSSIGHWWQDAIGKALNEGSTFERVGSRQLAGLLIAIWVRTSVRTYIGDLDTGAVACGLGRTFGNKGGVGLRLRVYDRIMCFVNCHFAAHLEAVNRRNADFNHIYRTMTFSRSSNLLSNASAGVSSAAQGLRGTNTVENNPGKGKPDLAEADLVIFCGDFNYRLFGISYDDARDLVSQRSFDWLRERDQLRAEMKAGKVFHGMREAIIRFPPTYKFERGKAGLGGYDSGEKKRIPAWCDRILYRDNRSSSTLECNLECPILASVLQYEACMDVVESDHKPVRCKLNVEIANVDRSVRRQELGKIINSHEAIRSLCSELCFVPKTDVSTNCIVLQSHDACSLKITNKCATDKAIFHIKCEGQATIQEDEQDLVFNPRGAFGFPRWLEVIPASGVIGPDQVEDISVRHEEFHTAEQVADGVPQSWWSEDTRDKEILLLVIVRGNCSTETKSHQVRVRHCYSCKASRIDSSKSGSGSRKYQGNTHHRSGKHGGNQSDDESRSSHGSSHGSEKDLQHKTA